MDADGTKRSQDKYGELKDQAGQTGAEASNKAQNYVDTHSPHQAEKNEMGMKEKMRQMGVSPINVQYPRIYL